MIKIKLKSDDYSPSNREICLNESKSWWIAQCALYSTVQYIHSNYHTLVLTSLGLACKIWTLVLTLKLAQEPKNAMQLHEVRLQEGLRGIGLTHPPKPKVLDSAKAINIFEPNTFIYCFAYGLQNCTFQ